MKTIGLNFQEVKKSHFIYALYILYTLQNKYSSSNIKCLMNNSMRAYVESCKLTNIFFDKDPYQQELKAEKVGAHITWDGISNIITKIDDNNSKLTIKPNKKESLLSRSNKPDKWLLYEEANSIIKMLHIKHHQYLDFVTLLEKKEVLKSDLEKAVDRNKTIIYVALSKKEIGSQAELFINHWLKKILETDSVDIIIKTDLNIDINHPHLFQLKKEDNNYYDDIYMINTVDIYVGVSGGLEQVAVFLKKPIFLFITNHEWSIKYNSCWVNYITLCNIRSISSLDKYESARLVEKAYLLFSDLIYAVNLNIKLSTEQLRSLFYAVENPIGMMFFNDDEKEGWCEKNSEYEQWIVPLTEEKWTLEKIKKLVKESNINNLAYICGKITWQTLVLFKLMRWQTKATRSMTWISNQYYKYVSVDTLIDGLQCLKEKKYNGK